MQTLLACVSVLAVIGCSSGLQCLKCSSGATFSGILDPLEAPVTDKCGKGENEDVSEAFKTSPDAQYVDTCATEITKCYKKKTETNVLGAKSYSYLRRCATAEEEEEFTVCPDKKTGGTDTIWTCLCEGDNCNAAFNIAPSIVTVLMSLAAVVCFYY